MPTDIINVDAGAPASRFPHFWEQMFGSGHANLSMRQSWRDDARRVKSVVDFRYVRFHDIFHDDNGVYMKTLLATLHSNGLMSIRFTTGCSTSVYAHSSS